MAAGRGAVSHVLARTRATDADRKPLAFIGHARWICSSAGLLRGRRATRTAGFKDCTSNAGALGTDEALVVDSHPFGSRTPRELPVFAKALVERLHGG